MPEARRIRGTGLRAQGHQMAQEVSRLHRVQEDAGFSGDRERGRICVDALLSELSCKF